MDNKLNENSEIYVPQKFVRINKTTSSAANVQGQSEVAL